VSAAQPAVSRLSTPWPTADEVLTAVIAKNEDRLRHWARFLPAPENADQVALSRLVVRGLSHLQRRRR